MLRPVSGISALNQCYQKAALQQGLWGQQLLNSGMEPEQLSVLSRVAPELGVTTAVAEGSRLLVVSEAVPVSEPPSVSEAVAVQVTSSSEETVVRDRSTVLTVDRVLPLLSVHT